MDVNALVNQAMFESLSQEVRDGLIKKALEALVAAPRAGLYDSSPPKTPLQEAFDTEVRKLAQAEVAKLMTGDSPEGATMRAQIRDLVIKGWEKALLNPGTLIDQIALAISTAFWSKP